uniref:Uncharacterized protein n=1 Tax=Aplanochytrium stocchinoi TaxID=215587 RepID=A0A7S3LH60_9STRA|mmetsp:Transcript_33115/g.40642  ORF Transcript_33115/g.40642 Transcript_33115/m.40642 type:complete len:130 (+) Transcript_33115:104-493(+)
MGMDIQDQFGGDKSNSTSTGTHSQSPANDISGGIDADQKLKVPAAAAKENLTDFPQVKQSCDDLEQYVKSSAEQIEDQLADFEIELALCENMLLLCKGRQFHKQLQFIQVFRNFHSILICNHFRYIYIM